MHDRTTPPCLTFSVGSDRIAYSPSRLEAKANERPAQLKRCSNMDIRLNIEVRCARRQNDAAYHHHRRRSVPDRHAIIIHRRHMEYQRSRGHVPYALDCKAAAESSSDRASFPGKRERSAHGERVIRAAGCDAHHRNSKSSAGYIHVEPRFFLQIWPFRIPI